MSRAISKEQVLASEACGKSFQPVHLGDFNTASIRRSSARAYSYLQRHRVRLGSSLRGTTSFARTRHLIALERSECYYLSSESSKVHYARQRLLINVQSKGGAWLLLLAVRCAPIAFPGVPSGALNRRFRQIINAKDLVQATSCDPSKPNSEPNFCRNSGHQLRVSLVSRTMMHAPLDRGFCRSEVWVKKWTGCLLFLLDQDRGRGEKERYAVHA